jgi:hypothetical protein
LPTTPRSRRSRRARSSSRRGPIATGSSSAGAARCKSRPAACCPTASRFCRRRPTSRPHAP